MLQLLAAAISVLPVLVAVWGEDWLDIVGAEVIAVLVPLLGVLDAGPSPPPPQPAMTRAELNNKPLKIFINQNTGINLGNSVAVQCPTGLGLATVSHTPYLFSAVQVNVNFIYLLSQLPIAVPQVTTL
jgi:hypothetical protein